MAVIGQFWEATIPEKSQSGFEQNIMSQWEE
jgi:hypothetical protein